MTYRYVTAGTASLPRYEVIWKGTFSKPIASCTDARDARRIVDALNSVALTSSGSVSEWHRVEERMPDDDILVLICSADGSMDMAAHDDRGWWDSDNILISKGTTHWADPAPPHS